MFNISLEKVMIYQCCFPSLFPSALFLNFFSQSSKCHPVWAQQGRHRHGIQERCQVCFGIPVCLRWMLHQWSGEAAQWKWVISGCTDYSWRNVCMYLYAKLIWWCCCCVYVCREFSFQTEGKTFKLTKDMVSVKRFQKTLHGKRRHQTWFQSRIVEEYFVLVGK